MGSIFAGKVPWSQRERKKGASCVTYHGFFVLGTRRLEGKRQSGKETDSCPKGGELVKGREKIEYRCHRTA